jgi:enoyl-CoA hydratase/carnithine racemase
VAGADISELALQTPVNGKEFSLFGQSVFHLLETMGKPSICAINGFALGGGCELALSCTIRIASRTAKLGQPEVKLGILPGYGGSQRLARLCGKGVAHELCLTGEMITAEEALRIGLVNHIHEPAELLPAAWKRSSAAWKWRRKKVCFSRRRFSAWLARRKICAKERRRFWRRDRRSLRESKGSEWS